MYARVTTWQGSLEQLEEGACLYWQDALPALQGLEQIPIK